jgi:Holliday junction DNA helicase RuvB
MERDILSVKPTEEDFQYETSLRPKFLNEYTGQERLKENLRIFIEAAKGRAEALDHVLFYGPPGLGKTTLAYIISNELGVNIKASAGPVIEKAGDLAALLTNLSERDVFFVDEVHRLNRVVEEVLYPAMEDYQLDIIIGQGPNARSIKLDLPKFTLVGATTRAGLLTSPLRDRFGVVFRLDFYNPEELQQITLRSARILNITVEEGGAWEIAKRSRGTPRVANRLLRRIRDFAQVKWDGVVTRTVADEALEMMEIDKKGLDKMDKSILLTIMDKFDGGPVGIETLSISLNEEKDTIEDVCEPFLIQIGYLNRTSRGRVATRLAYEHFGKKPRSSAQEELF